MSSKVDLQHKLNEIRYNVGPFTSKDTLTNIIRLHSSVLRDQKINVAKLNDLELRKNLTQHGLLVGPITNHTRVIYQRKLLEVLTNEPTEGEELTPNEITLYPNLYPYDEPLIIRNDYRATTSTARNTSRHNDSNGIRPRIPTKSNQMTKDSTSKTVDNKVKHQVATKKNGTFLYASITIIVALIVFVLYFSFEK